MPVENQATIEAWRAQTFGAQTNPMRLATRANEEMAELLRKLADGDSAAAALEECADVVIVLFGVAEALGGDLMAEIDIKMAINRVRRWKVDTGGAGYHVCDKEETAA